MANKSQNKDSEKARSSEKAEAELNRDKGTTKNRL